ncbi:MAG: metalloregulator ArsR/SmtB family transcription factor [Thermodesulfobacteriota bacterium]
MKQQRQISGQQGDIYEEAAECLRTIAHPTRLRIIGLLLDGPKTVGELALACGIPSSQASEHLRLLKDRGLLACSRKGRFIHYRVQEQCLASIMACIANRFGEGSQAG